MALILKIIKEENLASLKKNQLPWGEESCILL